MEEEEAALIAQLEGVQQEYVKQSLRGELPKLDVLNRGKLSKGMWGSLVKNPVVVSQAWIGTRAGRVLTPVYSTPSQGFRVDQVIDEKNMLIADYRFWVEGLPTDGMTDESTISLRGKVFEVRGTKQYATSGNSTRTVTHLVLIDVRKANEILEKIRHGRQFRIWVDSTGTFAVRARFRSVSGGKALMERLDGQEIAVPLSRLSKGDLQWVRNTVKSAE